MSNAYVLYIGVVIKRYLNRSIHIVVQCCFPNAKYGNKGEENDKTNKPLNLKIGKLVGRKKEIRVFRGIFERYMNPIK